MRIAIPVLAKGAPAHETSRRLLDESSPSGVESRSWRRFCWPIQAEILQGETFGASSARVGGVEPGEYDLVVSAASRQIGEPHNKKSTSDLIIHIQVDCTSPAIVSSPRASPRLLLLIIENASSRRLQEEEGTSAQASKLLRLSAQSQVQKDRQNISVA